MRPLFQPIESRLKTAENYEERTVRPWVKVSLCQYEELKRLREK